MPVISLSLYEVIVNSSNLIPNENENENVQLGERERIQTMRDGTL